MRLAKSILLYLLLVVLFPVNGQELAWSGTQKFRNKNAHTTLIGENRNGIFVLRSKGRTPEYGKVYVERYREDLSLAMSRNLAALRQSAFISGRATNNGFELVLQESDDNGTQLLKIQRYNENGQEAANAALMHQIVPKAGQKAGKFLVAQSFANKRMVFLNVLRGDDVSINLLITNHQYEALDEKTINLNMRDFGFRLNESIVTEDGDIMLLCSNYSQRNYRRWEDRANWYVLVLKAGQREFSVFNLNKDDAYLSKLRMSHNRSSERLIVSGFYGLKSPSGSKGTLDFVLDLKEMVPMRHDLIAYAYQMVVGIAGKKQADRGDELTDIELRKIVSRSDGGYILVGEEYYITEQSYTFFINGIAQVNTRNVYNYGKLLVISIGPNGEPEWEKVINKSQRSNQDAGYFTSVFIVPQRNRIDIIYNTSLDDQNDNQVLRYYISNDGKVQKESLLKSTSQAVAIIPRESRQIDGESVLFTMSKDRKFALLRFLL